MARRTATAKQPLEDTMEITEPLEPMDSDPVDQPGDEPLPDDPPADDPPDEQVQAEARDLDAEEAKLKEQLAELRKQKKEQKKGTPKAEKPAKEKVTKEKAPRPAKDEANGITRPMMGVTKEVWDTADMLSKRLGTFVDRATLTEVLNGKVEIGTIHTQYGRWRKYYGLTENREQRAERMAQIRAKKMADLGLAPGQQPQAEPQGEVTE